MPTKRERHQQLVTDRAGKMESLEALRAERSRAIIEGVTFAQTGEILALESDIDALDAAIVTADQLADAEEVREIAAQMAQTLAAQDEAACLAVDKFAKAAALAEAGFRQAVKALADMDELAAYIQRTVGAYNYPAHVGEAKPVTVPEIAAVSSMTLRGRISERIQQTLNPLSPEHGNYGHMTWAVAHARSDEDWATEERKILEGGLSLCRRTISQQIREYEIAARPA